MNVLERRKLDLDVGRSRNAHILPGLLAMTHMRWPHGQSGRDCTDVTQSVVPWCLWVESLAHRQVLEQGRKCEHETQTLCANGQARTQRRRKSKRETRDNRQNETQEERRNATEANP